jgi:hypothetical protein
LAPPENERVSQRAEALRRFGLIHDQAAERSRNRFPVINARSSGRQLPPVTSCEILCRSAVRADLHRRNATWTTSHLFFQQARSQRMHLIGLTFVVTLSIGTCVLLLIAKVAARPRRAAEFLGDVAGEHRAARSGPSWSPAPPPLRSPSRPPSRPGRGRRRGPTRAHRDQPHALRRERVLPQARLVLR